MVKSTVGSTVNPTAVGDVVNAFTSSTVILNSTKAYVSMSPPMKDALLSLLLIALNTCVHFDITHP